MTRMTWSRRAAALALGALALLGGLPACGDNLDAPRPSGLELAPAALQLRVGDTGRALARYAAPPGVDLVADDLAWSSSDPARAQVTPDSGGGGGATITALAPGEVTITAEARGLSATLAVSISPAALLAVAVAPAAPTIAAGRTVQLTATASYSDGSTADVTAAALWSSDRQGVATVFQGQVRGRAPGAAAITARFNGRPATAQLTVGAALLEAITVAPGSALVPLGTPQAFTAAGGYSDGSTRDLTDQVAWTSSDPAVATISNAAGTAGRAATVGTGPATITAALGAVSGTAQLVVAAAALQAITIAPAAPDVPLGADHPFTATGLFSDLTTADLTDQVTWTSSDPAVATISNAPGARGLADAVGAGATTITAALGAVSDETTLTVSLAPVGPWLPEPGVTAPRLCADGLKLSMASDLVYACTADGGLLRGAITGTAIAWTSAGGITNLQGAAVAAHTASASTLMYMAAPRPGLPNWFRSQDGGATFTAYTLLDSAGSLRAIASGRFQPGVGNLLGTWDPNGGAPQAVILSGNNPPTAARALPGASGTVRAIVGSASSNLYASVYGETPAGAPATGGVFRSTNGALTWVAQDAGIAAADRDRVTSLVMDPAAPAILYAGIAGGARVYKTTDGGATWAPAAAGLPQKARVSLLAISPAASTTLHAATQIGLYRSDDAGATWRLVGFQGRAVRAIAQSGAAPALVLVGVDDAVGLYRAP